MLPAQHRMRRSVDFRATTRSRAGRRAGTQHLVLHVRSAPVTQARATEPPRVGFVVSRAVGHAVARNRVARRLRALVAARLGGIPAGTDIVVRALPGCASADSSALGASLDTALARVGLGSAAQLGATGGPRRVSVR